MIRSRFLWKLYAGYAALILLTTGIVGGLLAHRLERDSLRDTEQALETQALLLRDLTLASLAGGAGDARLQARIAALGEAIETRLTVIAGDGTVLADSERDPAAMDNHGQRPEVVAARAAGRGTAARFSRTLGHHRLYLALRVEAPALGTGFVRTSIARVAVRERLRGLRAMVALGVALTSLLALAIGLVFARRITRPLLSMADAASKIAAGGYGEKVHLHVHSGDELGTLARAFNRMSAELRDTLAALTADRNKLTAILGSMAEGVVAVDGEERVVHMNRVAGELLGVDPRTAHQRRLWEVVRINEVTAILEETVARGAPVDTQMRFPGRPDRVIRLHATPLRPGNGAAGGVVIVLEDISRLRRLETMRQDFVANVSHELKTPVTAIRGQIETLLDDPEIDPELRRRFLERASAQTLRLSNLVNDLLALSRLEATGHTIETEPLDVRVPIGESVRALAPSAEARGTVIETALPPSPLMVAGEEEGLRQAVSNLLDNAIKYSPRGSRVEVRAERRGSEVVIEVEDHGIGIEPRHQRRIFERFYRIDKARSRAVGGTGLGLAIVKHLALALGGRVALDSAPGRGTVFRIHLPAFFEPAEGTGDHAAAAPPSEDHG